jgi:UDP-N-acetylmuramoyl-L-alanyl-D-glutamate--2,6-diaminopimelate ligase
MQLAELARTLPSATVRGDGTIAVSDATVDSRAAGPDSLFFCVPGERSDGHDFAADAVARGAPGIVVERVLDVEAAQIVVPSVRAAIGPLSAAIFGHPSRTMSVVGVTGTNGKTTSAFMLERAFQALGRVPGLIGTVEVHIGGDVLPVVHTTPEASELQRLFATMRDRGVEAVAMEVSSHGLAFGRVSGTRFACGLFTNLTRDHLDFHRTMEEYEAAKRMLFAGELAERGAVNADDDAGARLLASAAIPLTSYGMSEGAEVRASGVVATRAGSTFVVAAGTDRLDATVRIPGRYNVSNALGVIATFHALDLPVAAAVEGIAGLETVPGRMESIDVGQGFSVVVDYAHTPDSLANVLRAAREIAEGSLIVVFGCGGDRDRGKRPLMGAAAAELADLAIVTSDNPRSEDPIAIIGEITPGAKSTGRPYEIEPDRRAAIRLAFERARSGDVVVIAGKGHETGQKFADRVLPFDDRIVAHEELANLEAGR